MGENILDINSVLFPSLEESVKDIQDLFIPEFDDIDDDTIEKIENYKKTEEATNLLESVQLAETLGRSSAFDSIEEKIQQEPLTETIKEESFSSFENEINPEPEPETRSGMSEFQEIAAHDIKFKKKEVKEIVSEESQEKIYASRQRTLILIVVGLIIAIFALVMINTGDKEEVKEKEDDKVLSERKINAEMLANLKKEEEPKTEELLKNVRQKPENKKTTYTARRGSNYNKDKDIINKYKEVNPNAASDTAPVSAMFANIPKRKNVKGGLNIIETDKKEVTEKKTAYNLELKVYLKKGVRSSANSRVVAILKEAKEKFPQGTIFYGTASFNNKRTYINFTEANIKGEMIKISGEAMTGKDPGIPSEITEISDKNASASLKSGAVGLAGKIADNALSNATGGTTSGTLSNSTNDLQGRYDKDKLQYEYFVAAQTPFTIYLY